MSVLYAPDTMKKDPKPGKGPKDKDGDIPPPGNNPPEPPIE